MIRSQPKIAVIDDDMDILSLIAEIFEHYGYDTHTLNGIKDISVIENLEPDIVLLDLEMPYLSGEEILTMMKASPTLSQVPVIIITGLKERTCNAKMSLADAVLEKPFSVEELINKTVDLLG